MDVNWKCTEPAGAILGNGRPSPFLGFPAAVVQASRAVMQYWSRPTYRRNVWLACCGGHGCIFN